MLTFDKIRDLERVERQEKKLQKIPEDTIEQIGDYLRRKEKTSEKSSDIVELENIKSTIKRFFEHRESKILMAVLDTIKTGLPPENMTQNEEKVYGEMVDILKKHRQNLLTETSKPSDRIFYIVRKSLPSFIGPDMKDYNLRENDVVEISSPLSDLLLKQGIIEKTA